MKNKNIDNPGVIAVDNIQIYSNAYSPDNTPESEKIWRNAASNGNNNISSDSDPKRSAAIIDNDEVVGELKYLSALVTKMDIRINNLCTDLTGKSYEKKQIGF